MGNFVILFIIWKTISTHRQIQLVFVFVLILASLFIELMSIGMIIPIITLMLDQDNSQNLLIFEYIKKFEFLEELGNTNMFMLSIFVLIVLLSGITKFFLLKLNSKVSFDIAGDLSVVMYKNILQKPFIEYRQENSNSYLNSIINSPELLAKMIFAVLNLTASSLQILVISSLLVYIQSSEYILGLLIIAIIYAIFIVAVKNKLLDNGKITRSVNGDIIKLSRESFGMIREIILSGAINYYSHIFKKLQQKLRKSQGENIYISGIPNILVEVFLITLIIYIIFIYNIEKNNLIYILPKIGLFIVAVQKLFPLSQKAFASWASIVGTKSTALEFIYLLQSNSRKEDNLVRGINGDKYGLVEFSFSTIEFKSVYFSYPDSDEWVVNGATCKIERGDRIAVIGTTGSGKSTFLDLLLGLLTPSRGSILVDGRILDTENMINLQRSVGYVSQNTFMLDTSVAENIAFGLPVSEINLDRVKYCARVAKIDTYIEGRGGYFVVTGEGGINFSGGQIKRIAIARALYAMKSILVLDESTSALDLENELDLMRSIYELKSNITILIVSHGAKSLYGCTKFFQIENGIISTS